MSCRQIFTARMIAMSASSERYCGPTFAPYNWVSATPAPSCPWQVDGTFSNASIELLSAPGSGKSFTFTLVKNGADTGLSLTVADSATTATDLSGGVSVVAGDLLYWKCVPSIGLPTTSDQRITVEFAGATANESGYASIQAVGTLQTFRGSVFMPGQWNTSVGLNGAFEIVAAAGNLTALAYRLTVAPGASASHEFALYKNGTKQDGSGGSVDTRVTISGASATTGSWTGTVACAAGDLLYVEQVPSATAPAASNCGFASKFVATTDGESQFCATVFGNLPTTGGPYYSRPHWQSNGWNATEANETARGSGESTAVLKNMRARIGGGNVATGPITFKLRLTSADAGPAVTISSGNSAGSDTASATLDVDEPIDISYALTATPGTARIGGVSFVLYSLAAPSPISAVCFSLDGNNNAHSETGKFKTFGNVSLTGYLELTDGITAPATASGAAAGMARIYIDSADGDLKIKFADGTVKTIVVD